MNDTEKLISLSRAFHLTVPEQAFGRCFGSSLALASVAAKCGIALELICWQVFDERDFCDHWAVLLDGETVFDPTHVQVDGDPRLINRRCDYPVNYRNLRRYPAQVLLPIYDGLGDLQNARFSLGFMWRSKIAMACFDMRTALRTGEFGALGRHGSSVCAMLLKFAVARAMDRLLHGFHSHHMLECRF